MSNNTTISRITLEEFYQNKKYHKIPVIITDYLKDWQAPKKWDKSYFKSAVSNDPVRVVISKSNAVISKPEKGFKSLREVQMGFHDFLDTVYSNEEQNLFYYLQQQALFKELAQDVQYPKGFENKKNTEVNIWIGSGGNITPIHYDTASNFLAQVKGSKRIVLFPPSESKYLYPFSYRLKHHNLCPVDFNNPDYDKYPNFAKASPIECTIKDNEVLYIPIFWWHYVETVSKDVTISVNFWWNPPVHEYLSYLGIRTIMHNFLKK